MFLAEVYAALRSTTTYFGILFSLVYFIYCQISWEIIFIFSGIYIFFSMPCGHIGCRIWWFLAWSMLRALPFNSGLDFNKSINHWDTYGPRWTRHILGWIIFTLRRYFIQKHEVFERRRISRWNLISMGFRIDTWGGAWAPAKRAAPENAPISAHPGILNLEALRDALRRAQGGNIWIQSGIFVLSFLIAGQAFGIFSYFRNH